jgi:DNA-binding MarR family transcriptional regulator
MTARCASPSSPRASLVRITDAGKAVLAERLTDRAHVLRARLGQLDESDQRLLLAALPAIERLIATNPKEAS